MEGLAERIAFWCLRSDEPEQDEFEIIKYGLEVLLENLVKAVVFLVLGIVTGMFFETLAAMGSFCVLRSFAGGIHMKTGTGCFLTMFLIWGAAIGGSMVWTPSLIGKILILLVCLVIIALYAPSDTVNNPIVDAKIRRRKKRLSILTILIQGGIVLVAGGKIPALVLIAVSAEAVTILPLIKILNERRKEELK